MTSQVPANPYSERASSNKRILVAALIAITIAACAYFFHARSEDLWRRKTDCRASGYISEICGSVMREKTFFWF